jgi:Uncharacterised nucleotidyltransferase
MSASHSLPSLKTVERLLLETTERVAAECGQPTPATPHWGGSHWCIAQAVAAIHGVSPLLSRRLLWHGPHAWQQFLGEQWQHTLTRQQALSGLIARLDARARDVGIPITALKGAALHDLSIYEPGMRPMADLDLLVHEHDAAATASLLEALGYRESYRTRRERVFLPHGHHHAVSYAESAERALKIELHTRIAERLPIREVDITELVLPRQGNAGIHHYASLSALMTHLLLHAAGNIRPRALRLIHLHDIAALAPRLSGEDWDGVLGGRAAHWWAYPPLALTARYFPAAIPSAVLFRAATACPSRLRRIAQRQLLSDVSLSHLWIEFCPGIEWCGSIRERIRFVGARIFPDAAVRGEIRANEANSDWTINNAWARLSRPRRMLRWALSRTPRVATLWSVREAWQQGASLRPSMPSASLTR